MCVVRASEQKRTDKTASPEGEIKKGTRIMQTIDNLFLHIACNGGPNGDGALNPCGWGPATSLNWEMFETCVGLEDVLTPEDWASYDEGDKDVFLGGYFTTGIAGWLSKGSREALIYQLNADFKENPPLWVAELEEQNPGLSVLSPTWKEGEEGDWYPKFPATVEEVSITLVGYAKQDNTNRNWPALYLSTMPGETSTLGLAYGGYNSNDYNVSTPKYPFGGFEAINYNDIGRESKEVICQLPAPGDLAKILRSSRDGWESYAEGDRLSDYDEDWVDEYLSFVAEGNDSPIKFNAEVDGNDLVITLKTLLD